MASGSWIFIVLFFLVFLCVAQNSSARKLVKHYDGHGDGDDHDGPPSTTTTIHMDDDHHHNMESSEKIFFTMDDLKKGKSMPIYFSPKSPSKSTLLSLEEANSIPFSSSQLPSLLQLFSFSQHSPQAQAMNYTLSLCELEPIQGETKLCATSLESMLDFARAVLGLDTNLRVLTTTFVTNPTKPFFQNYTVLEAPRVIFAPKMVACHSMPYPYAVFYCHTHESENRVFETSMEGREDGGRVEAVGVCHMDTSHWDRDHVSFRLLNVKPGTSPVCHVFPPDNLVWVPNLPA